MTKSILCLASMALSLGAYASEDNPLWLRYPSISPDGKYIAFTYQGDIYKVSSEGGKAERLTTNSAYDYKPVWSPDGKQIAFASDRNRMGMNLYIMNSEGGEARLLSKHTTNKVPYSFTPDGKYLLFKAHIQDDAKNALHPEAFFTELYRIALTGNARPERVLDMPAEWATMSKDGSKILYQNLKGYENEWRKHHTSSVTRDIVEYDVKKGTYRYVVKHAGEDRNPLYSADGKSIYFLSERNGATMNVYKCQLDGSSVEALTSFKGEPVRFLSTSNAGTLAFGYGGEIYTLAGNGKPKKLNVSISSDTDDTTTIKLNFRSNLRSSAISPDGKQIAFVQRGEVFVTSADYSTTKRITNTAAAEQGLTFSIDGRTLVYASCCDGKWELYKATMLRKEDPNFANATTIKEEKLLPNISGEKAYPQYSPDGKEIAFVLDRKKLAVYNFDKQSMRIVVDTPNLTNSNGSLDFEWSPDSKWIAFSYVARRHAPYSDIGIVSSMGGEIHNITNSGYFSTEPRWSSDGNALIFSTDRYGMRNHASWGSMMDVMMVFLNREAYESYRMTEEEFALAEDAKKAEKKDSTKDDKKKDVATTKSKDILIEWNNLDERIVRLTPNSSDLGSAMLSPDGKKLYYFAAFEGRYDLWSLDLPKKTTKLLNKLNTSAPYFAYNAKRDQYFILGSVANKLDTKTDALKPVSFSADMRFSPRQEREAMYNEVVREQAIRFYKKDMHGVNWSKLTEHYRRYLPYISNNYDFAEMLSELLGELNVSHTGSRYRTTATAEEPTAELGILYNDKTGKDGLLVTEVLVGGPFDKSTSKLKAGDLITAIDGTAIKAGEDFYNLLAGKNGKNILVTYQSDGAERTEMIKAISAGAQEDLLTKRWVKSRAELVDKLSGGQLGYVHIASMGDDAFRNVYSEVMGRYYNRKGIVIDIRHNGGGRLHEDIEVFFSGEKYLQQEIRGEDYCEMPSRRWNHASVMLVCENDYSNAHGTPWVYQTKKMGKVVGMPVPGTMTSVNWVTMQDNTMVFGIPAVGYRTKEGTYLENTELKPDVEVEFDPLRAMRYEDSQLERAVEVLMNQLGLKK